MTSAIHVAAKPTVYMFVIVDVVVFVFMILSTYPDFKFLFRL